MFTKKKKRNRKKIKIRKIGYRILFLAFIGAGYGGQPKNVFFTTRHQFVSIN